MPSINWKGFTKSAVSAPKWWLLQFIPILTANRIASKYLAMTYHYVDRFQGVMSWNGAEIFDRYHSNAAFERESCRQAGKADAVLEKNQFPKLVDLNSLN